MKPSRSGSPIAAPTKTSVPRAKPRKQVTPENPAATAAITAVSEKGKTSLKSYVCAKEALT